MVSTGPQDPTLDKFFAQHNSEDNASFQELLKASQDRLRKAKPWLFKNHNPPREAQLLLTDVQKDNLQPLSAAIAAPSDGADAAQQSSTSVDAASSQAEPSGALATQQPNTSSGVVVVHDSDASTSNRDADKVVRRSIAQTDGYGTTGQESQTLLSWPHTNKSALYYDSSQRDVVPYTEAELAEMVQGPPKQIKHSATRFPSDFDPSQQTSKVTTTLRHMRLTANGTIVMQHAGAVARPYWHCSFLLIAQCFQEVLAGSCCCMPFVMKYRVHRTPGNR